MSEFWFCLKKSFHCNPQSSEAHEPKTNCHHKRKTNKDNSDSSNVKNCKNHDMQNPVSVTHEIVFDTKSGGLKICPCFPSSQNIASTKGTIDSSKTHCVDCDECGLCGILSKPKMTMLKDSNDDLPAKTFPHEFGEKLKSEKQDIYEHSVINLHRQDSSWQIIKRICEASNVNGESNTIQIEYVLKVQNTQKSFACFEKCKEMVKISVERLQIKHPRCLVDGNEMLRFHGTAIACSLGINGSCSLCTLDQCGLCQILRHGFSSNHEFHGTIGVYTTSTCEKAIDSICSSKKSFMRKCVLVCRVIAGRINNPLQEIQEMTDSGYDSLVKKISCQSDIEELIVLNSRGVLPCFVVMYKF